MMEQQALLGEAHQSIKTAEHLFEVTFPLCHDAKLLLAILRNLHTAHRAAIHALLECACKQKKILQYPAEYKEQLSWLQTNEHSFSLREMLPLLLEIDILLRMHEQCPIEFVRKDRFVLCTDTYNIRVITSKELKVYLTKTKLFIEKIISDLAS